MTPPNNKQQPTIQSFLLGGVLPIAVYTILEEKAGPLWGLIFGMGFGVLEVLYEGIRYRKVETITWVGNGLLIVMGAISIMTQEGLWFKLQPAFLELGMALLLIISQTLKKPFLVMMAEKQQVPPILKSHFGAINLRLGFFFLLHACLAVYAALFWSTRAWALLKGVGLTLSLLIYFGIEILLLRRKIYDR